jgi:signal transduction histidine kinase
VRASGQGLGLSIVQRAIDRLGGRICVEGSGVPGQGSVFGFTLPKVSNHNSEQ